MKYAYYPGCSLESTARDYNISAKAVCQALDIELQEIPDWICCGASSAHMTSELLSLALPVKNLLVARDMGLDIAVCCAACYNRLKIANKVMRGKTDHRVHLVDKAVGRPYRGETSVKHLLEIVTRDYGLDALHKRVSQELGGLEVAAYYGCLLLRPPEAVEFDDPENPTTMEKLITALGAQPVDWSYRTECCGASLGLTRTDVVLKLCRDILQMAVDHGADCLMVACPLCHANLDMRQMQVNKRYKTNFALPVFYFTQLIGLSLGLQAHALGLEKLFVQPNKLPEVASLV
jgi:heterodisulfide reductase subunit B